jgi:hypothetical protein
MRIPSAPYPACMQLSIILTSEYSAIRICDNQSARTTNLYSGSTSSIS